VQVCTALVFKTRGNPEPPRRADSSWEQKLGKARQREGLIRGGDGGIEWMEQREREMQQRGAAHE